MSIQSQLNNQAFVQLPLVFAAMKDAARHTRASMETTTLPQLDRCSPCLDDMSYDQKATLDSAIIDIFKNRDWI
jgi:hypothetical protein